MGTDDKIDAKKDQIQGKFKEEMGDLTDDESREMEGKLQGAKGDVKEAVEKGKDAAKRVID